MRAGLTRHQLICVAMLSGCDYTVGIMGVGVVTALEILAEFVSHNTKSDDEKWFDALLSFAQWHRQLGTRFV